MIRANQFVLEGILVFRIKSRKFKWRKHSNCACLAHGIYSPIAIVLQDRISNHISGEE